MDDVSVNAYSDTDIIQRDDQSSNSGSIMIRRIDGNSFQSSSN